MLSIAWSDLTSSSEITIKLSKVPTLNAGRLKGNIEPKSEPDLAAESLSLSLLTVSSFVGLAGAEINHTVGGLLDDMGELD